MPKFQRRLRPLLTPQSSSGAVHGGLGSLVHPRSSDNRAVPVNSIFSNRSVALSSHQRRRSSSADGRCDTSRVTHVTSGASPRARFSACSSSMSGRPTSCSLTETLSCQSLGRLSSSGLRDSTEIIYTSASSDSDSSAEPFAKSALAHSSVGTFGLQMPGRSASPVAKELEKLRFETTALSEWILQRNGCSLGANAPAVVARKAAMIPRHPRAVAPEPLSVPTPKHLKFYAPTRPQAAAPAASPQLAPWVIAEFHEDILDSWSRGETVSATLQASDAACERAMRAMDKSSPHHNLSVDVGAASSTQSQSSCNSPSPVGGSTAEEDCTSGASPRSETTSISSDASFEMWRESLREKISAQNELAGSLSA